MPTVLCHACAKATTLPDGWARPSYECPHCGVVVTVSQPAPAPSLPARVQHTHTHRHTVRSGFNQGFGGYFGQSAGRMAVWLVVLVVGFVGMMIYALLGGGK